MIHLKAVFVISVLISGIMFSPSYSFAQGNNDDNPFSSLFEIFTQFFSFEDKSNEPVVEFREATIIQTSGTSSTTDTTPHLDDDGDTIYNEMTTAQTHQTLIRQILT